MGFVSLVRSFSLSFTLSELYCRNIFSSLLKLHSFISEYITRNALTVNPFACHPVNISRKSSPHSRTEIYSDELFTINSISIISLFSPPNLTHGTDRQQPQPLSRRRTQAGVGELIRHLSSGQVALKERERHSAVTVDNSPRDKPGEGRGTWRNASPIVKDH